MGLQNDRLRPLAPRVGRTADEDIAQPVLMVPEAVRLGDPGTVAGNLPRAAGAPGNGADFLEKVKYRARF